MTLGELRTDRQVSQRALAVLLDVRQPSISRFEAREIDTVAVGSLRRYVEALGGRLEIIARFGGERVMIQ